MGGPFGKRVGGVLCFDFVNTVKGRVAHADSSPGRDYADRIVGERISSYDTLVDWAVFAEILSVPEGAALKRQAAARPDEARAVLERALAMREALYRGFKATIEEWTPEARDLAVVNSELQIARAHQRLVAAPRWQWAWDLRRRRESARLDRMLWPVALSAADLLTGPALDRVGQCPGNKCGWFFLDTSRSRRRQWCDMAECGNLAKVHRFRERQRAVP